MTLNHGVEGSIPSGPTEERGRGRVRVRVEVFIPLFFFEKRYLFEFYSRSKVFDYESGFIYLIFRNLIGRISDSCLVL